MRMVKTPSDAIRNSAVRLMPGRYAVLRRADVPDGSGWFMITRDPDEVTVIVEESAIPESRALETDGGYGLVEIRVATGFESVGLLATVTRALAEAGLNIPMNVAQRSSGRHSSETQGMPEERRSRNVTSLRERL
jgi:hypothetical protein